MSHQNRSPRAAGYALLLTVILLALTAAGMAAVARRSYAAVLDAGHVERRAQREWLIFSAQQLLAEADTLLTSEADPATRHPGRLDWHLDLGHHRATLRLADEQAKANLNTLWSREDPATFSRRIKDLEDAFGGQAEPPVARAVTDFKLRLLGSSSRPPPFLSFEQLWSPEAVRTLAATFAEAPTPFDHLTLWGDGKIRADRAGQPALRAMLSPLLSDSQVARLADHLVRTDDLRGAASPSEIADLLDLTDRQQLEMTKRLTDGSNCFSARLWLEDGLRTRSTLLVRELGSDDGAASVRFDW